MKRRGTGGGIVKGVGLVAAMILTQACVDPRTQSNARIVSYERTGEERAIDPATGETVITSHWEYDDGYKTTTKRRIPRGTEERQQDRERDRPPIRVSD
jgi:hypothetical protein